MSSPKSRSASASARTPSSKAHWARAVGTLITLAAISGAGAPSADVDGIVARVTRAAADAPWIWSPSLEGLADFPYTYQQRITRKILGRNGRDVPPSPSADALSPWRTLELERIPLAWGAFFKCLSQDGTAPCPDEWVKEFERQTRQRDSLTEEQRAKIDAEKQQLREQGREFWKGFGLAFRCEAMPDNQLRFSPAPGYKPRAGRTEGLLGSISGQLRYDPATYEVTRLEYQLVRTATDRHLTLKKGDRFIVELDRAQANGPYLPIRVFARRAQGNRGEIEERTASFSGFRRFQSDSTILPSEEAKQQ